MVLGRKARLVSWMIARGLLGLAIVSPQTSHAASFSLECLVDAHDRAKNFSLQIDESLMAKPRVRMLRQAAAVRELTVHHFDDVQIRLSYGFGHRDPVTLADLIMIGINRLTGEVEVSYGQHFSPDYLKEHPELKGYNLELDGLGQRGVCKRVEKRF